MRFCTYGKLNINKTGIGSATQLQNLENKVSLRYDFPLKDFINILI